MSNTYINDNATSSYPLYGVGALPFSNGNIVGLGISIKGEPTGEPVYLSSVTISTDIIHVVICRGNTILGVIKASTTTEDRSGKLEPYTDTAVSGYLIIGSINDKDIGSHAGTFYLDPSCVVHVPDSVYGVYTKLKVNDKHYALGHNLTISVAGLMSLSSSSGDFVPTLQGKDSVADLVLSSAAFLGSYSMVTSINGISPLTTGEDKGQLILNTRHPEAIKLLLDTSTATTVSTEDTSDTVGGAVLLTIIGTTQFPNCYDPDEDEAGGL